MYQNILVPLDGSHNAKAALLEASQLAHHFKSTLHLITIVNEQRYVPYGYGMAYPADLFADLNHRAEQILTEAQALLREHKSTAVTTQAVVRGIPKKIIAEDYAKDHPIDLIVMGKSGVDALSRVVLGSTTAYVVRHSPTNVLVISDPEDN
jgi:nucleotide-binding universal stress UspA family protein